jgi:hypothetical protein
MADLWVVVTIVAFFGLCVALVLGCDRIIGPDDASELEELDASDVEDVTAEAAVR